MDAFIMVCTIDSSKQTSSISRQSLVDDLDDDSVKNNKKIQTTTPPKPQAGAVREYKMSKIFLLGTYCNGIIDVLLIGKDAEEFAKQSGIIETWSDDYFLYTASMGAVEN